MYKKCFIISGRSVFEVYDLGNSKYVQVEALFTVENENVFETKFDAMYANIISNLQKGKPLSNYRASKYYNEYIERLKVEHPEYII